MTSEEEQQQSATAQTHKTVERTHHQDAAKKPSKF
jgi:hypothetical protein